MLPLFISIFIILLIFYLIQRLRYKLPPGPRPWPVVGNLYDLKPVQFRCFNDWARAYGPIISVWFGSSLNVVVSSPELAKQVLKEHDQVLSDRQRPRTHAKYTTAGKDLMWVDYDPHFVKLRKLCNSELLSASKLGALRPIRDDETTAMINAIYKDCTNKNENESGQSLLLRKYLGGVAFNHITRLVFGKKFVNAKGNLDEQGMEFKATIDGGKKLLMKNIIIQHIPWLRFIFPAKEQDFIEHANRVNRLTTEIMEEHTRARLQSGDTKQHFVDALLTSRDQYDLTNDNIVGLLWNMILGGMDTTAIAVEWAMAELLKNPRSLNKAQEELDKAVGPDRTMTEDDIPALPYLQAIVKESMRLHPPSPLMLPHKARAHVKIGGYDIPEGTTVHVNVWAIGRNPNVWSDPLEFRPERFLEMDIVILISGEMILDCYHSERVDGYALELIWALKWSHLCWVSCYTNSIGTQLGE